MPCTYCGEFNPGEHHYDSAYLCMHRYSAQSNAKLADTTLDSFDNTGAAAKAAKPVKRKRAEMPMCQICRTATYVEKSKYPESGTHFCCGAGCNSFFTPAKDNAKLADTTLDSFDTTGAAAKPVNTEPICPGCKLNRFVGKALTDGVTYHCTNVNCTTIYFVPVNAEPVKSKAVPSNQMYQSLKATFSKCLGICERKSHDYAKGENPYRNFEGSARIGVSVQKGLLVRLQDKFTRLENLIDTEAQVSNETFEDTIDDLINYAAILKARREFERNSK